MRVFQLYIHDNRYSVPTLSLVTATDPEDARALALSLMAEREHHLGVEVFEAGARLFGLGSLASSDLFPAPFASMAE